MKDVAVSQCTFPTNGHAVVSNWISGNRLRPTYSVCKIPYVVSWCTFLLYNFALTSHSADINAKSFRWNSSSIFHGVGQSIIKTYIMSKATTFYINIACSYHFITTTQKDFVSFLYLCTQIRQRNKRNKKNPIRNETLYAHKTSQSFVQSYRSFERNSYVHTSSTSDTAGIGFPHHYSHSYFYRLS